MSLDFNLDKIADYENLCWLPDGDQFRINPVTQALIFHTINVGINVITATNAEVFADRVAKVEKVKGPSLTMWEEGAEKPVGCPITAEDVRAHIGLRTNASALTKTAFEKRLLAAL